ncbi:glycosyltransferase [Acetobacter indonesiensis]|uniref:Glycosyl transferase n=1 Tax=Acetobacter indonesiensis TaxID=104101 RepID=A0A252AUM5_9PROT|nr:glycosyltransferase [Acetobacter indonesiensis]OUI94039.1 glycosyl transferase [Acetobacter indonesiensis]
MSLSENRKKFDWSAFDLEWYKKRYQPVLSFFNVKSDEEIRRFYETRGLALKHSPNLFFDEAWYISRYPVVVDHVAAGDYVSGFDHYCKVGFWSCNPHWLFDEDYYRRNFLDFPIETLAENGFRNGYDHYLNQGGRLHCASSPFFDPAVFLADAPDFVVNVDDGPYISLLKALPDADLQMRRFSPYFDPEWYLETYPEVKREAFLWNGPLHHYLANAKPTHYNPNAYFSEQFYAKAYEDVADAVKHGAFRNCYEHFVKNGQYELRQPAEDVKLRVYAENPKVKSEIAAHTFPSVFVHYIAHGGIVEETGYTAHEREYISKSVYQDMCRVRLPLLLRSGLDFSYEKPEISVIIIVHNNFAMTMSALASLRANYAGSLQVILVDSGSSDETRHIERFVKGLDVIRALGNVGFLMGCNEALGHVKADFTLYLNNDLELMPNALENAVARFTKEPNAGAVGAKLVRTNGLLQEAGSIIWGDGGVCGYLRDHTPDSPEANYVRSVDFCSGAFLLVRTDLLRQLSGFDPDYAPAYFEETDLCVRIRQQGADVVYDPAVVVVHYEYGTSGTLESNQMMVVNQQKFIEKNRAYIETRPARSPHQDLWARSAVPATKHVLFIEDFLPFRHLGSGFTRSNDVITAMVKSLGCHVTVYPVFRPMGMVDDTYSGFPDRAEIVANKGLEDLAGFLNSRPGYYDVIWVARTHNAERLAPVLAECAGALSGCSVVLDTEAVASGRELQKWALKGEQPQHSLEEMLQKEFRSAGIAQKLVAVNQKDATTLRRLGHQDVSVLGHLQTAHRFTPGFTERQDILFVGAVHDRDSPNLDSLIWFANEVLPLLDPHLPPDVKFRICGYTNPDIDLKKILAHPRVDVVGRVEDVTPYYNAHRVFVAPTRFAGGIPYKLHEAAAHGIPIVASDILCEQVGWQSGEDLLGAATGNAAAFAHAVVSLYQDRTLWQKIRRNELRRVAVENEPAAYVRTIQTILDVPAQNPEYLC